MKYRRAHIKLSREHLARLLGFDVGGIEIVTMKHEYETDIFIMYLRGDILPECKEGEMSPEIEIEFIEGKTKAGFLTSS